MNSLMWAVALQILSVALLFAEIFLPSGGMLGLAMTGTLIGSLVVGFTSSPLEGWMLLGLDILLFPVLIWWGIKQVERSSMALPEKLETGGGADEALAEFMDKTGVAETDLRPVGRVRIGTKLVDAQARTGFVVKGTEVEVVSTQGNHLVVKVRG